MVVNGWTIVRDQRGFFAKADGAELGPYSLRSIAVHHAERNEAPKPAPRKAPRAVED